MELIDKNEREAGGIEDFISLAEEVAGSGKSCPDWNLISNDE